MLTRGTLAVDRAGSLSVPCDFDGDAVMESHPSDNSNEAVTAAPAFIFAGEFTVLSHEDDEQITLICLHCLCAEALAADRSRSFAAT